MSSYGDFLLEELSDSEYAKHFFNAVVSDFMETGFFPAFLEATDLLIKAQKDKDLELVREVYYVRGSAYFYTKEFDKAKENFECATKVESDVESDDSEAQLMISVIAHYTRKPEDAKALLIDYWGLHNVAPRVVHQPPQELRREPVEV